MEKRDKDLGKRGKDDDKSFKKDQSQKPRMKKPGEKGFVPHDDKIGDGSAGMSGTSAI